MLGQKLFFLLLLTSVFLIKNRPISTITDIEIYDAKYIENVFDCLLESEKFIENYIKTKEPERMIDLFIQLVIEGDKVATECFIKYPPPTKENASNEI